MPRACFGAGFHLVLPHHLIKPHPVWKLPLFAQGRVQVPVTHLKPDGIDHFTEHKEGQDPESTENGGEDELQPGPDITM